MTIQKAILGIDAMIKHDKLVVAKMKEFVLEWTGSDTELPSRLALTIRDFFEDDLKMLEAIKKQLKPKCRHPKKSQDVDPDGILYCTRCNQNI